MAPTVIDSSAWIEFLRGNRDHPVFAKVQNALKSGRARLIPPVLLELWNSAGNPKQKKTIRLIEETIPAPPVTDLVWKRSVQLAQLSRESGQTLPHLDLLIFATAQVHNCELIHNDHHLTWLEENTPSS